MSVPTIVILTFEGNPIAADLFETLRVGYCPVVIYTSRPGLQGLEKFSSYMRRKRGLRWWMYDLLVIWSKIRYKVNHIPKVSWDVLVAENPESFYQIKQHNSQNELNILQRLAPKIGVVIGTPLINPSIYKLPELGMINLHQANLEVIRGAPPAYWEHRLNMHEMCVTVHKMEEKFDAGGILCQHCFGIDDDDHFIESKFRANKYSVNLLVDGIDRMLEGSNPEEPNRLGKLYTVPSLPRLIYDWCKTIR